MGKLRDSILTIWQADAGSPDEPDNAQLARWVGHLVTAERDAQRRSKDSYQRIERLRQEVARAYALPTPQGLVTEAAIRHLDTAFRVLDDEQGTIATAIDRIKDAKNLLTGQPVEPCPGGCGIDLGHPGNPDRRCVCPKRVARTWEQLPPVTDLPAVVEVRKPNGATETWRRHTHEDRYGTPGQYVRTLNMLRERGDVREVQS